MFLYVNIAVLSVAAIPMPGPPTAEVCDPEEVAETGVFGAVRQACMKPPKASIISPKTFVECNCMS